MTVRWSVSSIALPGQNRSGDVHVLESFDGGLLLGAVDGLGHGDAAALAAETAVRSLSEDPALTVLSLVQKAHDALRSTRGVVMSLASFRVSDRLLTWLGVGNIEGVLLRANPDAVPPREVVALRGGVVGYQLPQLHATIHQINPGDVLVFATDGIRNFQQALLACTPAPLEELTRRLCAEYSNGTDDVLAFAARFDKSPDR